MTFSSDLAAFQKKVGLELKDAIESIALEVYKRVTLMTPRDTGRAAANWNISASQPDLTVTSATRKDINDAVEGLLAGEDNLIWITNSLAYIFALEHGWSAQAPQGMAAISVAEVREWIRSQIV